MKLDSQMEVFTEDKSMNRHTYEKDMVSKPGQTAPNMRVIGKMTLRMERVKSLIPVATLTKETGKMIRLMEWVSTSKKTARVIRGSERMTFKTAQVLKSGLINPFSQAPLKMGRKTVRVNLSLQMEAFTRETLKTTL